MYYYFCFDVCIVKFNRHKISDRNVEKQNSVNNNQQQHQQKKRVNFKRSTYKKLQKAKNQMTK